MAGNMKKQILTNILVFLMVIVVSFGKVNYYIYPLIFAFSFALINNKYNLYAVLLAVLAGFLIYFSIENLIIALNLTACLIIFDLLSLIKNKKIKHILSYFLILISQSAFLFFNSVTKTGILSSIISIISSFLIFYIINIAIKSIKLKKLSCVYSTDEKICLSVLIICLFYSLAKIEIFNVNMAYLLIFFAILFLSLTTTESLILKFTLFSAIGVCLTNYSLAPFIIFLVWATVASLSLKYNKYIIILSLILSDIIMGTIFNVYFNYSLNNLIIIGLPSIAIMLIKQKYYEKIKQYFNKNNKIILNNYIYSLTNSTLNNKLITIDNSLENLKNIYQSLLGKNISSESLSEFLARQISEKYCKNCKNSYCTMKNDLKTNISALLDIIKNKGKLNLIDVPSNLSTACLNLNEIFNEISVSFSQLNQMNDNINSKNQNYQVLLDNFISFKTILKSLTNENKSYRISNKFNSQKIINEFAYYNLFVKEIVILEDNFNNFYKAVLVLKHSDAGKLIFQERLSSILKLNLKVTSNKPSEFVGFNLVTYEISPKFQLFIGISQNSKEKKCGDNYFNQKIENNHLIALADGMGSGENANFESNICLNLLFNLQKIGLTTETSTDLINKMLIPINNEKYTTLDAVNINLFNGQASFIKFGTTLSIIERADTFEIIKPKSLPLGIISNASGTVNKTSVSAGDYIFLMSDGVVDAFGEDFLISFINSLRVTNAQLMSEDIVEEASIRQTKPDDLTCIVIKVANI